MWILVIGREGIEDREGSAVACLHELGCEVQTATLWDRLDTDELVSNPPAAVLIEDGDEDEERQRLSVSYSSPYSFSLSNIQ